MELIKTKDHWFQWLGFAYKQRIITGRVPVLFHNCKNEADHSTDNCCCRYGCTDGKLN